jgi:16S rRNA (cytosine1402-N4)-methyltransferase
MSNDRLSVHIPVMLESAVGLLGCRPGGLYVDGTLGGGSYAEAILQRTGPRGRLIGLDWDAEAIARVSARLAGHGERVVLRKASFGDLAPLLSEMELGGVDGIVLDLGVSSPQLEDRTRGFSFMEDGPLDMRMDRSRPDTAADLVNGLSEGELAKLIRTLGEERWAKRIARAIVSRRKARVFSRTKELADLVAGVVPRTPDSRRIHPATRTFQALRVAVNEELEALRSFLGSVLDVLNPGGRLCIVAFHSLEDRMVKEHFRRWASACRCPVEEPFCRCEGRPLVRLLAKKALRPTEDEVEINPRARSARLRAMEKHGEAEDQ